MSPLDALRPATARLRDARRTFVQVALAIAGSWLVATEVLGYHDPFFAPIAAVIVLNTVAQRGRRAVEIVVGVATGIAVADLLVVGIGTGGWQLVLVSVLAMATATAAGGGPIVRAQATVAAILVVTLQPPTLDLVPHRFFHAAIGGATALLVAALLPRAPERQLRRTAGPLFDDLAATLTDVSRALREDDHALAHRALDRARELDAEVDDLRGSIAVAHETARIAPHQRRRRGLVDSYAEALEPLDFAVRDTRVLARAAVAVMRHGAETEGAPTELADAVLDLADAVRALGAQLTGAGAAERTRRHAGAAAARTRPLFADAHALAVSRVVGQIRATGIDLLRGSGLRTEEAQRVLYDAPDPSSRRTAPGKDHEGP
ncbi:MAG: FUSC family protein [Nitriliruptor sp.]|uniref:aromatic acid exporter family protein n=1 Tax=Nitriliruptor sp. TaxID=2448056 RepID=UPI0034A00D2D